MFARFLAPPQSERFLERLVIFFLEDDEAAIAVSIELSHPTPVGVESVHHNGIDETSIGLVQRIQETPRGREFTLVASVLAAGIAVSLLMEYRLDGQDNVEHRPEKHGDDIAVIVLLHLFDLTPGALDFEVAHQTLRAVAIVGGEGLPAIDGPAAQGTVGTFAESFVALGLGDDLCKRAAHAAQLQLV